MKLNKVKDGKWYKYDEASLIYIQAIVNKYNLSVSEAIEYIENEEANASDESEKKASS